MDMTFYDFSAGHDDFSSTSGILSVSPFHVTSPLGSWLAISSDPTTDTFSEWFRSTSSNVVVQGGITLSYDNSTTTSVVRRYKNRQVYRMFCLVEKEHENCKGVTELKIDITLIIGEKNCKAQQEIL